jgi:hypothetical protein
MRENGRKSNLTRTPLPMEYPDPRVNMCESGRKSTPNLAPIREWQKGKPDLEAFPSWTKPRSMNSTTDYAEKPSVHDVVALNN